MRSGLHSTARRGSRIVTAVAVVGIVAAPLLAVALSRGSPDARLAVPVEPLVVTLLLLAVTARALRMLVAALFGIAMALALAVAALDLAFTATIDRRFDPVQDAGAIAAAVGVVADATGPAAAWAAVGIAALVLIAAAAGLAAAALRVARATDTADPNGRTAVTALTAVWIAAALTGAHLVPGVPFAAEPASSVLTQASARAVQSVRDDAAFERALGSDPLAGAVDARALAGLDGKDVVFAFVESYGEVAVRPASFTDRIAATLRAGEEQLARDGYAARSALLESPTFGGVSWLAHATLQSGVWVDSQGKYDRLTSGERQTLTSLFAAAGWRTVAVVPSNTEPWPLASTFYGYDAVLDARNSGYRGPAFGYARIPDQFTWQVFHERARPAGSRPVMAEIDLVSSHTPWTPLPRLVPWDRLGDGTAFEGHTDGQPSPVEVWGDPDRVRGLYAESVAYSLGAAFSYLHEYPQRDLVLVLVGDHQPSRIVSGSGADRDVPVTVIAQDPAVFEQISSWGWEPGLHPSADAPRWRMDEFRDRFVAAFSG